MDSDIILVIDEGTTSTRAIAFDRAFNQVGMAQSEIGLSYPKDGWVEQDPAAIWLQTVDVCRSVIDTIGGADRIAGIGITNQRETSIIWDRETGTPIAPAIIWQDRRTSAFCESLKADGHEATVQSETGLLLDPYFSGSKIRWLLDNTPGARDAAKVGKLAFGTVDSWLIWNLTSGKVHATDVTNAARTLLWPLAIDPAEGWSDTMAALLDVPTSLLPTVLACADRYGETDPALFGKAIPIFSAIGDQQAALVGQGCLRPSTAKITFGTGAFLVANTGDTPPVSSNRLLATAGYAVGDDRAFALEGSIFNAGTVVKWLRDDIGLIGNAAESEEKAAALADNGGVYMAPAFTGLGAPHWDADARGLICGLTRSTRAEHLVRAGLEAAAYQTRDLLDAFAADGAPVDVLKVDGGMAANNWLMQFLADVCETPVERPDYAEMTALGAAACAGMMLGWTDTKTWSERVVPGRRFEPAMHTSQREELLAGWKAALARTTS